MSGCAGPLSTLDPGGPAARIIATLWWVMLVGATAIFALVMALLALAFRSKRLQGEPAASERVWIVGLGLAFPAAVLLSLLTYGLWAGERLLPWDAADVARVHAQAERWSWTFSYDDAPGRTTTDILHIPANRPVDVAITTADVIHSFWVPRLAGKLDAIPGHVNVLRLEADVPGTYAGLSAEYSGPGYDRHSFTVIAHTPDSWRAFLEVDE
ncbi:cytochrome c oxidase subunit II [Mesorhizobium sediminum]